MFTLACGVFVVSTLLWAADSGSKSEVKSSSSKYSNEDVRDRLRRSEYDNHESQEIARRLRTDNYYRQDVEKLQRRGLTFQEAVEELRK